MANVLNLTRVLAVYGGAQIESVKSADVLENGFFGVIGDLVEAKNAEVRGFVKPATANLTSKAYVIADAEIMADQSKMTNTNLAKFSIPVGEVTNAYELKEGDYIEISASGITPIGSEPAVGKFVELVNGSYLLKEVASGTVGQAFLGKIESVRTQGLLTYVGSQGSNGTVGNQYKMFRIRVVKNA